MNGFFLIARALLSHWLWLDDEPFCKRAAWIDLIGLANHSDTTLIYRGEVVEGKRGEVNRSIRWLADRWHWSRDKVNKFLTILEKEGMITVKEKSHRKTVIIVENYASWQDAWQKKAPQKSHRKATEKPQKSQEQRMKKNEKELKRNSYYNNDDFLLPEDVALCAVPPAMQSKLEEFIEKEAE